MEWFSENWVWLLFFGGMVAMHLFGHGGHGGHGGHAGHGGHGGGCGGGHNESRPAVKEDVQRPAEPAPGHHH